MRNPMLGISSGTLAGILRDNREGAKMEYYKRWLNLWQHILDLNQSDIYMYGRATYNSGGDIVIVFEDKEEQENYKAAFPNI